MAILEFPIQYFPDPTKGRPVFNGSIFVGLPDTDPKILGNQVQLSVIEADGTVVPVSQPILTNAGGTPTYQGLPVQLSVDVAYSLRVDNAQEVQVYYVNEIDPTLDSDQVSYQAGNNFAGGVDRTQEDKNSDLLSVKDFGAVGDGATDDGINIDTSLAFDGVEFPAGAYENKSVTITQDFTDTALFHAGADINNSGSGTTDFQGVTIREGYNPGGDASWTTPSGKSYEGFSADLGGYGPRDFGGTSTHTGVNGSVKVPASSTAGPHASGITGYCRTASTTTGAVAVYGEAIADATGVAIFGFNSRSIDDGIQATVWGSEIDINISNAASTVRGIDLTGGTTVQPATAEGYRLGPLGVFPPLIQWDRGFVTADNAAKCALDIGSLLVTNSGMQPINGYYRNGSDTRIKVLDISADSSGNLQIGSETAASLFELKSGANKPIKMLGNTLGFFGTFPIAKPVVVGSIGGNVALGSLLTALDTLGLITNSSTP